MTEHLQVDSGKYEKTILVKCGSCSGYTPVEFGNVLESKCSKCGNYVWRPNSEPKLKYPLDRIGRNDLWPGPFYWYKPEERGDGEIWSGSIDNGEVLLEKMVSRRGW